MAKKEKAKSLDNSQHVFNSRFSWDMPCPYPSTPNVPFHIPPEKNQSPQFSSCFQGG